MSNIKVENKSGRVGADQALNKTTVLETAGTTNISSTLPAQH